VLALLAGAALCALALLWIWRGRRRLLAADGGLPARLFGLLAGWARRLHIAWPASHTPLEHAQALGAVLPGVAPRATRLAHLFAAQRYGRLEPDTQALAEAASDWRAMQPLLWRAWLLQRAPTARWHRMLARARRRWQRG
jgi:hypothetical protein